MAKSAARKDRQLRQSEQRELQRQAEVARAQARRRHRQQRIGFGIVAIVAIVAAALFALTRSGGSSGTAVAASLGAPTSDVPSPLTGRFNYGGSAVRHGGKPELLFIGAQYCPYCGAERWAVIKALAQFGSFSGLRSSTNQQNSGGYGLIPTFAVTGARYSSQYVAYDHKDLEDRNGAALQSLTGSEQALFNRYDSGGSIPLVLIGGYYMVGSGYDPGAIDGKSFGAVQSALQSGTPSQFTRAINAEANVITALICHSDGMRPAVVCGRAPIGLILRHLK